MPLVARPLAGPGTPGTALDVVKAAGWNCTTDEAANAYATSPDRRVIAAFLPENNHFAPGGPLWLVRAYGDLNEVIWQAAFTEDTPSEFIAAFLTDLIKPEPLETERDQHDPSPSDAESV